MRERPNQTRPDPMTTRHGVRGNWSDVVKENLKITLPPKEKPDLKPAPQIGRKG